MYIFFSSLAGLGSLIRVIPNCSRIIPKLFPYYKLLTSSNRTRIIHLSLCSQVTTKNHRPNLKTKHNKKIYPTYKLKGPISLGRSQYICQNYKLSFFKINLTFCCCCLNGNQSCSFSFFYFCFFTGQRAGLFVYGTFQFFCPILKKPILLRI